MAPDQRKKPAPVVTDHERVTSEARVVEVAALPASVRDGGETLRVFLDRVVLAQPVVVVQVVSAVGGHERCAPDGRARHSRVVSGSVHPRPHLRLRYFGDVVPGEPPDQSGWFDRGVVGRDVDVPQGGVGVHGRNVVDRCGCQGIDGGNRRPGRVADHQLVALGVDGVGQVVHEIDEGLAHGAGGIVALNVDAVSHVAPRVGLGDHVVGDRGPIAPHGIDRPGRRVVAAGHHGPRTQALLGGPGARIAHVVHTPSAPVHAVSFVGDVVHRVEVCRHVRNVVFGASAAGVLKAHPGEDQVEGSSEGRFDLRRGGARKAAIGTMPPVFLLIGR